MKMGRSSLPHGSSSGSGSSTSVRSDDDLSAEVYDDI